MSIPNTTYRVLVEKLGDSDPSTFVGNEGELFYDPNNPEIKLSDGLTAGGLSTGGAGGSGLTVNDLGEGENYTLQLSDAGKAVKIAGANLTVPSNLMVPFPIGTLITIIVGPFSIEVRRTSLPEEEGDPSIVLAGTNGSTSGFWGVPEFSVATLLKVEEDTWYLSGPGITDED
jgi:hypothetical protein